MLYEARLFESTRLLELFQPTLIDQSSSRTSEALEINWKQ